jgi:putative heme-binding domain-containing protein
MSKRRAVAFAVCASSLLLVAAEPQGSTEAEQRAYALATKPDGAWQHRGSARRGERIFGDPSGPLHGICATCHKVRGLGGDIGPDLTLVGSAHPRAELITSILEPSQTILFGFEQIMVETTGGEVFTGALRQERSDSITVRGADGIPHTVARSEVKTRQSVPTSLMPPGLTLALKPEQFVDLIAYLETLKGD